MDDYDPVKEIRMHWTEIIEQALECPICLEVPIDSYIYMCINGHDVCERCKKKLDSCPVCQASFGKTRNRCMEELAKKFEEMKTSLLDPDSIRQMRRTKKKTVETQTEALITLDNNLVKKNISTQTTSTDAFSSGSRTPRRSTRIQQSTGRI